MKKRKINKKLLAYSLGLLILGSLVLYGFTSLVLAYNASLVDSYGFTFEVAFSAMCLFAEVLMIAGVASYLKDRLIVKPV
jgi:hypothetical protein